MGFWSFFVVALYPVMKVLLVTLVGLFLGLDRINILGPTARSNLNRMVFYVFSPALVGGYLADTVTWEVLVEMWFMPVNILLTFIVGSALGWVLVKITRTPPRHHGLIIGCCAAVFFWSKQYYVPIEYIFTWDKLDSQLIQGDQKPYGNLGNLMLIMIPAICDESDSPFGDSSTCTSSGDAYVSLSMALGAVYTWSYVYILIKVSNDRSKSEEDAINSSIVVTSEAFTGETTEPLLSSEDHASINEDCSCNVDMPAGIEHEMQVSQFYKIKEKIQDFATTFNLKMIFAPSIIAAIIGFTVGLASPLRKLIIGDSAPLRTIYASASLIGQAAVPCITLILGANLLKGFKSSGLGSIIIIGIMVVRYVALPGVGIGVVKAAHHFGWVGSSSLYQFVLMLQFALPPAMNVGTITQLFEMGQNDCSVIMFWSYAVATISLTLWSTVFLSLVS